MPISCADLNPSVAAQIAPAVLSEAKVGSTLRVLFAGLEMPKNTPIFNCPLPSVFSFNLKDVVII